jgi:putative ABC transport system permease protein
MNLLQDLRYGIRMLLRSPGFTAVAVLTLALGIGATSAIFSVIDAVLLRPLPYNEPDRLVMVWGKLAGIGLPRDQNAVSVPEFIDFQTMNQVFERMAASTGTSFNLTVEGSPERVQGASVSASLFPLLRVQPVLGRTFRAEEDQPGRDNVVLLSHGLWQRRFGSDPSLVGKTLTLNGRVCSVIGILPPNFEFPAEAEIWRPIAFDAADLSENRRADHFLTVVARLKPGVRLAQAQANMDVIARRLQEKNPAQYPPRSGWGVRLTPLLEEMVEDTRPALLMLLGAVALLLVIACANVANLLLARASARQREIAIRAALGAGRGRLIRQLLTESCLLGLLGGALGLLLALWGGDLLVKLGPENLPRLKDAAIDGRTLGFTLLISLGANFLFGLAPAWQACGGQRSAQLKEGSRGATASPRGARLRGMVVVSQISLSLVLLVGAGLLIKSFVRVLQVDPGFNPNHVLSMRINLPSVRYPEPRQAQAWFRQLLQRVETLPGVEYASLVSHLPLGSVGWSGTFTVEGLVTDPTKGGPEADRRPSSTAYFRAMGIPLLRGRFFDSRDEAEDAPKVAIVDETLAETFWRGQDPIGKRLKLGGVHSSRPWMSVVGVVRHVKHQGLDAQSRFQMYWPYPQQLPQRTMSLVIRTRSGMDPRSLTRAAQNEVLALDKEQPVFAIRTMEEVVSRSVAQRRLSMLLLVIFAAVAVTLATVGIYGVMSYSMAQRTHEIGIRMALGARAPDVLALVAKQALTLVALGVAVGLAGALLFTRSLASLLFQVQPGDPAILLAASLLLAAVALGAGYIPAHRAVKVDPMTALRCE